MGRNVNISCEFSNKTTKINKHLLYHLVQNRAEGMRGGGRGGGRGEGRGGEGRGGGWREHILTTLPPAFI